MTELLATHAGRLALAVVAALALATLTGLVALWPEGGESRLTPQAVGETEKAKVVEVSSEGCESFAGPGCRLLTIELLDGPNEGERSFVTLPSDRFAPRVGPGDRIRVSGNAPGGADAQPYAFVDFERQWPLTWLALAFAAVVIVLGRLRGMLALVGLGVSLAVLVEFVVPAILEGEPALLAALVGSSAVMLVTIVVTHGLGAKAVAAILGTGASLLLTAGLAKLGVSAAQISGFSSEESTLLLGGHPELSLQGLVLAGMLIGALGVLDDVTVSQSSTVMALRRANPAQGWSELFRGRLSVGRDHVTATVNTLVLAYAGAALPVLLIFANQGTSFGEAINREPVATEVVGMLVGSIGLIAAVPLTTLLAALLARRLPASALRSAGHHHAH